GSERTDATNPAVPVLCGSSNRHVAEWQADLDRAGCVARVYAGDAASLAECLVCEKTLRSEVGVDSEGAITAYSGAHCFCTRFDLHRGFVWARDLRTNASGGLQRPWHDEVLAGSDRRDCRSCGDTDRAL